MLTLVSLLPLLPLLISAPASAAPTVKQDIPISNNVVPFVRKIPASAKVQQERLNRLNTLRPASSAALRASTVSLNAPGGAAEYAIQVTVGGQNIEVIADTGSSDLWFPTSDFQCLDQNSNSLSRDQCNFGPSYYTQSSSFSYLTYDNNFNISYGDGEFVSGYGGIEKVTIGSITVPDAEFGVATIGYWSGDDYTNGLLGLANPLLTSIFYGKDGSNDSGDNEAEYNPWFYQAVKDNLVAPYFSLVLNRATFNTESGGSTVPNLGSITFGGKPSTSTYPVTGTTVTVPNVNIPREIDGKVVTAPAYYTVKVDSFNFPGSTSVQTTTQRVIIDSGTTLLYLPTAVAKAYNAKWPKGARSNGQGEWIVSCRDTPPSLSVTIGGQTFTLDAADLIYPGNNGQCISSVLDGGSDQSKGIFILGDRFMVNVVSTFNIQNNQITIDQRKSYKATA